VSNGSGEPTDRPCESSDPVWAARVRQTDERLPDNSLYALAQGEDGSS
jgi:hypothetical protein